MDLPAFTRSGDCLQSLLQDGEFTLDRLHDLSEVVRLENGCFRLHSRGESNQRRKAERTGMCEKAMGGAMNLLLIAGVDDIARVLNIRREQRQVTGDLG